MGVYEQFVKQGVCAGTFRTGRAPGGSGGGDLRRVESAQRAKRTHALAIAKPLLRAVAASLTESSLAMGAYAGPNSFTPEAFLAAVRAARRGRP